MALGVIAAAVVVAANAAVAPAGKPDSGAPTHLTIAYQQTLGAAPLILMKHLRVIEKRYPGTTVDWKVLASGTPITTVIVAGEADIGALGIGPMLVAWSRGVNWRILASLNLGDVWLMAKDPSIRTIADLRGKRIATPTNTSTQAVALRKMAQVKLGDAHALDSGLIALDHPDGMQALLTGQVDAHFTAAPYEFEEKANGAHIVARSYQYFGPHIGLLAVAEQSFYDDHPAFAKWFYDEVRAMHAVIKKHPATAAHVLQEDFGGSPSRQQFKRWLLNPALTWTTRPRGLMAFATFMYATQQISRLPSSWRDLVFPPSQRERGS